MQLFAKRFIQVLTVLCPITLLVGFGLMLFNMGVIKLPAAPVDEGLIYNGKYVDLLSYGQQSNLNKGGTRVTLIDQRTGLPAALNFTLVDEHGKTKTDVNVVRFTYQGLPAMLRFTNNVADGFTYLNYLNMEFDSGNNVRNLWKSDPNFLQEILKDYASQVSAILGE